MLGRFNRMRKGCAPTKGRPRGGAAVALASVLALCLATAPASAIFAYADQSSVAMASDASPQSAEASGESSIIAAIREADTRAISDVDALTALLGDAGIGIDRFLAIDANDALQAEPDLRDEIIRLQRLLTADSKDEDAPDDRAIDDGASDAAGGSDDPQQAPGQDVSAEDEGDDEDAPEGDVEEAIGEGGVQPDGFGADSSALTSRPESEQPHQQAPASESDAVVQAPSSGGLVSSYPSWSYEGDTTLPTVARPSMTTTAFIALYGEQARAIAQEADLYASVMLAQAILESASGTSALAAAPYNNLFGVKAVAGDDSVTMLTSEQDDEGNVYTVRARFRCYESVGASLEDYADLLSNRAVRLYQGALKSVARSSDEACEWLQGRYATDVLYAKKLKRIIQEYDLTRYDEPLGYELVEPIAVPKQAADGTVERDPETGSVVMEERGLLDLVSEASSHLGEPYVWGGSEPGAFDCSGLVQYSYQEALSVHLPRTTYFQCLVGEDVDFADLHMGDLVFFVGDAGLCTHVGMYLGEGCYLEAPRPGGVVQVTSMEQKMPAFAKRVLATRDIPAEEDMQDQGHRRHKAKRGRITKAFALLPDAVQPRIHPLSRLIWG